MAHAQAINNNTHFNGATIYKTSLTYKKPFISSADLSTVIGQDGDAVTRYTVHVSIYPANSAEIRRLYPMWWRGLCLHATPNKALGVPELRDVEWVFVAEHTAQLVSRPMSHDEAVFARQFLKAWVMVFHWATITTQQPAPSKKAMHAAISPYPRLGVFLSKVVHYNTSDEKSISKKADDDDDDTDRDDDNVDQRMQRLKESGELTELEQFQSCDPNKANIGRLRKFVATLRLQHAVNAFKVYHKRVQLAGAKLATRTKHTPKALSITVDEEYAFCQKWSAHHGSVGAGYIQARFVRAGCLEELYRLEQSEEDVQKMTTK